MISRLGDPTPTSSIAQLWLAGGTSNYTHYDSPAFADAYTRAITAPNRPAALRAWRAVFQQLLDDAPGIWLYSPQSVAVAIRRVADVRIRPDAPFALLRTWRIPSDQLIERDRVERR